MVAHLEGPEAIVRHLLACASLDVALGQRKALAALLDHLLQVMPQERDAVLGVRHDAAEHHRANEEALHVRPRALARLLLRGDVDADVAVGHRPVQHVVDVVVDAEPPDLDDEGARRVEVAVDQVLLIVQPISEGVECRVPSVRPKDDEGNAGDLEGEEEDLVVLDEERDSLLDLLVLAGSRGRAEDEVEDVDGVVEVDASVALRRVRPVVGEERLGGGGRVPQGVQTLLTALFRPELGLEHLEEARFQLEQGVEDRIERVAARVVRLGQRSPAPFPLPLALELLHVHDRVAEASSCKLLVVAILPPSPRPLRQLLCARALLSPPRHVLIRVAVGEHAAVARAR
eukprot:566777-Hanusia_phi.AAC.3